jgi:hypothetical protein
MRNQTFLSLASAMADTVRILVSEANDIDANKWTTEKQAVEVLKGAQITARVIKDAAAIMEYCLGQYIRGDCGPLVESDSK